MEFTDGVATFTLKDGASKTATGLPAGTTYEVTEAEANQDGYTTTVTDATGIIQKGNTAVVQFINSKNGDEGGSNKVDVTVKKVWKLDDGSKAVDSVTVVLLRDGKEYQRVELSKQNGWTYIWTELSDRYTWTVIEVDIPDGFTSTISQEGNLWTITNDDNPKIPVDPIDPTEPNEPTDPSNPDDTKPPQTGDAGNLGLWFVLMAVSTAGLGSVILLQKRRRSKVK